MLPLAPFILLCILTIFGCVGNLLIIAVVCLTRKLRVRANAFVLNLAAADLIITGYVMPVALVTSRHHEGAGDDGLQCDLNAFLLLTSLAVWQPRTGSVPFMPVNDTT